VTGAAVSFIGLIVWPKGYDHRLSCEKVQIRLPEQTLTQLSTPSGSIKWGQLVYGG
jgi:hypothetical protein